MKYSTLKYEIRSQVCTSATPRLHSRQRFHRPLQPLCFFKCRNVGKIQWTWRKLVCRKTCNEDKLLCRKVHNIYIQQTRWTHIQTINEIQNNAIWNSSTSMYLSISSSTDAVKTPSFSPAILFVWMWECTKYNEHEWKLVCTGEQVICTYSKWQSTNRIKDRQKHEPLLFCIHGCKYINFFPAQNISQATKY